MQKTPVVVAILASLLLAGCQSPPEEDGAQRGCEPTPSGQTSDAVTASGRMLTEPTVRWDGSLSTDRAERTVLSAGDGRVAKAGALVTFAYIALGGSSGEVIDAVGFDTSYAQAPVDETALLPGLQKALLCSTAGSRVAAVIPPFDAFGESGNEEYGVGPGESIVFVIDVVAVASDRAHGERQPVRDSLPQVHVGATGEPLVTIPTSPPPVTYSATVLKKGDGELVKSGAKVTVEYLGKVWSTDRIFDSTWHRDELVQLPTTSFLKGVGDALVGQTVGSQVLAIVPPASGYGEDGNAEFGIDSTDTLVYVIDILAVVQPPTEPTEE